eukprot:jgi/Ulvmu1/1657/UM114_0026.1
MGRGSTAKAVKHSTVTVSFFGTAAVFRCESESVDVPAQHVARSQLLVKLQEQSVETEAIEVAINLEDLRSWTSYLEAGQPDDSPCDNLLLGALEAATFLRDDTSAAEIVNTLCQAFTPPEVTTPIKRADPPLAMLSVRVISEHDIPGESRDEDAGQSDGEEDSAGKPVPTEEQRERAFKILSAAPVQAIHSIIAAVAPAVGSTAHLEPQPKFQEAAGSTLAYLLLLLPPTLHPAVLHMRCPSIQHNRSLSIPHLYEFKQLDCTTPERSSLPVAALAAAAVFASGSPAAIWDADKTGKTGKSGETGKSGKTAPLQQLSSAPVPLTMLRAARKRPREDEAGAADGRAPAPPEPDGAADAPAAAARSSGNGPRLPPVSTLIPASVLAPSAAITQLTLASPPTHAVRYAAAVRQLSTLCDLRLEVHSVLVVPSDFLTAAVFGLRALTRLHVRAQEPQLLEDDIFSPNVVQPFLGAVSRLPGLVALRLERIFATQSDFKKRKAAIKVDTTVDQLSRLKGLTELSLRDNRISRTTVPQKLSKALKCMKKLQVLSVANMSNGVEVALGLYGDSALPALQVLDVGGHGMHRVGRHLEYWAHKAKSGGSVGGLTALGLEQNGAGLETNGLPAKYLTPWPTLFPGLQSVNLQHSSMKDVGLQAFAEILPQMRALDAVNLGFNGGTHEGVFPVLTAAAKLAGAQQGAKATNKKGAKKGVKKGGKKGGAAEAARGLRRLSVAGATVGQAKAPELVVLLSALGTLEELDVRSMGLQGKGVAAVARTLPSLPKLHAVNLSDNGQSAEDVEAVVPLLAAATGLRRLVMHEEAVEDVEAVRRAVERAAPWLTAVTLGAAHEAKGGGDDAVVAFQSAWRPSQDPWFCY